MPYRNTLSKNSDFELYLYFDSNNTTSVWLCLVDFGLIVHGLKFLLAEGCDHCSPVAISHHVVGRSTTVPTMIAL